MTRRDAAWVMAGGAQFFAVWANAAESYQPKFFPLEDFSALEGFASILIPTDETPGAREAQVAPFIDFVVNAAAEYAPEMQGQWRSAMDWLRARNFAALSPGSQHALVMQMSEPERDPSKSHDGFPVYRLIKEMTVRAFYTSRVGLIDVLEYKGNAYLTGFPGCNHPEHRKI